MNLTSPILKGAAHAAELPGNSVTSFLKMIADSTGLFADDSPDSWLGMLMSGLSGVAACGSRQVQATPISSDRGIWPIGSPLQIWAE
jgi:hypothetical protein